MTKVQLVLPVYNEQQVLPESVSKLRGWCLDHPEYDWQITIANNASTDDTLAVARKLELTYKDLVTVCLVYTSPSPRDLSTSRMPSSA